MWFRKQANPVSLPASPGGSVVDPALLRQAADRGVTICFADLDGADGLWVPEERTVLVNRGLSDAAVAEVIEHELAHVAIDDQHADLDAGREVMVGRPPARRSVPVQVLLAAAAFVAVVGGVLFGVSQVGDRPGEQLVGPAPEGLTASEGGGPVPQPSTTVVVTRDAEGRIVTRTITVTAPAVSPASTAGSLAPTPVPTVTVPRTSSAAVPARPAPTRTPAPVVTVSASEPTPTPSPTPTTPVPTVTPPATGGVVDPGDGGDGEGGIGDVGDGAGGVEGSEETVAGGAVVESASAGPGPATTGPTG